MGWFFRRSSFQPPDCAKPQDQLHIQLSQPLHSAQGPLWLDVDLQIPRGQRLALLGASGSGKTSLLRLLAGLMPAQQGRIWVLGRWWLDTAKGLCLPPRARRAGFVFQDYALFPNMTARGNLCFALPKGRPASRADDLLALVGLEQLAHRYPARLSGGQQQRLALARALAAEPELLLLDEPLSALDGGLRRELQDELLKLHRQFGTTLILVTHDPGEALRLCERAVLLEQGRIVADAAPAQLFGFAGKDSLVLQGRIIAAQPEYGPQQYWVEAEGQGCSVRVNTARPLQPGEVVLLSATEWMAQPLITTPNPEPSERT